MNAIHEASPLAGARELENGPTASAPSYLGGADLAMRVMALRGATRNEEQENAAEELRESADTRRAEMEARLQQVLKAAASREEAGFWSGVADVCKVVGIVASVVVGAAAAAFTGGTSAVAAVAVIAALTAAQVALPYVADEVGRALGASEKTMMWVQLGVSLACIALSLLCPTNTAGAAADGAVRVSRALGEVAAGAAQVGCAVYTYQAGRHDARAMRHEASALAAGNAVQDGLDDMQVVLDRAARASRQAVAIMMSQNDGTQAALRA